MNTNTLVVLPRPATNPNGQKAGNLALHLLVNVAGATQFVDWVRSCAGQAVMASYKIGGEQLFFPNANP